MKGQVWMLNVWASWCVACKVEHPLLVEMQRSQIVPLIGLDYKDQRPVALKFLSQNGDPYNLSAVDAGRPRRHRLRRLWRARDLHHRQERRHPPQADRPDHARSAREDDPAADREAEEIMKRLLALLLLALALGAAGAKEAAPLADDPAVEQRLVAISEEMRCLVCQNESLVGLALRPGAGPAARTAHADQAGQDRRRNPRVHGQPLRRLRALPAPRESHHLAAVGRAVPADDRRASSCC